MKHRVLLLGAGKIGRMIARFLVDSGDYELTVGDVNDAALKRVSKSPKSAALMPPAQTP
jgi:saccharopine dehydrogenase-like NADP-dependent oxidoreductase